MTARRLAWMGWIVLASCVACGEAGPTPNGEENGPWLDAAALSTPGFGRARFRAGAGHALDVHVYRPHDFDSDRDPIWFVVHGASRAVERYVTTAAPVAERHSALVLAVHFPKDRYPRSVDFTLGLERERRGPDGWSDPHDAPMGEIERIFDAVKSELGGEQTSYYLFGHSAGAQFIQRLLTFLPSARVEAAVAANAGWYTLPETEDPQIHSMPYGLADAPSAARDVRDLLSTRLTVLLGEDDTSLAVDNKMVRSKEEAMAQGPHRLARGLHYYESGRERARELGVALGWRVAVVPAADHDAAKMIDSAASFLFVPGYEPGSASRAAEAVGLMFTEILADPPRGDSGDANRDGVRDAQGDEFVEIVNTSDSPIYLDGWTLGDAHDPDRHVFPLAEALAPGEVLLVFGGGIPTGDFHGARVQWTDGSLGLSNDGDVLTLRDAEGEIVLQFSWGDCDGQTRAGDHFEGDLGLGRSIERAPREGTVWSPTEGALFTPGEIEVIRNE